MLNLSDRSLAWLSRVALFGVVLVVALWASQPYAVGVYHDDGVYVLLARALAAGDGYRYLHLPGTPAATHYPPGYPFFLSLLTHLAPSFPANTNTFLFANAVLLALAAVGAEWFARAILGWPRVAAVAGALIGTLSYPLILLSGLVLSEPLFVALLLPALVVAERLVARAVPASGAASPPTTTRAQADAVLVGCVAGMLALVRTHGIALIVGLVGVLMLRRRWRVAMLAVVAAAAFFVVPWEAWSRLHRSELPDTLQGSYGSYGGWLARGVQSGGVRLVLHTVAVNLREFGALLADRFALHDSVPARTVAAFLATFVFLAGAWAMRRRAPVTLAFMAVFVGIILVWPYTPWRFVFALWPVVILTMGEGIRSGLVSGLGRGVRMSTVAVLVVLVAGTLREEARAYAGKTWRDGTNRATAQIGPLIRWVSRNTNPDDIVAVEGEQLVYLFTGRRAVPLTSFTAAEYMQPPTVEENAATLASLLKAYPVAWVVTVSPPLAEAADRLTTPADGVVGDGPRLVRMGPLPGAQNAAAYRVEH